MSRRHYGAARGIFLYERGASILEFALLLPFVAIIISAIVDYGLSLRRTEVLANAARHGARAAAAYARDNDGSFTCPGLLRPDPSCAIPLTLDCSHPLHKRTIECLGARETARYLDQNGLSATDWQISAQTCRAQSAGGLAPDMIQVAVRRAPESKDCILCWFTIDFERADASFALEGNCS